MRDKNAEEMVSNFAKILRQHRQLKGFTYDQLAVQSGIHRTTISLIEREKQAPTLLVCKKLANSLNIPLYKLVKDAEKTGAKHC